MKARYGLISLGLGMSIALAVVGLLSRQKAPVSAAPADATRYVATTGSDTGNDCTSPDTPCETIQYALDLADPGDTIKVAAGTYTDVQSREGVTQVAYISKSITLGGGYTTADWVAPDPSVNPTTLDAHGQGRVVYVTGKISPTIENLHITGGDATGLGGLPWPGSNGGGGIYVITAAITVRNCEIFSNTVAGDGSFGGGICLYEVCGTTLSGNTISQNIAHASQASKGGGVYIDRKWQSGDPIRVSGNTITANTVSATNAYGGGVELFEHSAYLTVTNLSENVITNNTVDAASYGCGGGLRMGYTGARVNGNVISSNSVTGTYYGGGGICLGTYANARLVNNIIAGNSVRASGSGVHIGNAFPGFLHTTIVRNVGGDGSGVHVTGDWGSVSLVNTVLVGQAVGIRVDAGNTVNMEATLWGDGGWANSVDWMGTGTIVTGTHNYWGDPVFVDPDAGDYHISPPSAALDRGIDMGVDIDIDSEPRISLPDLGADEYWAPGALSQIYLPLTLRAY